METQERLRASTNGRANPLTRGVRDLVCDVISLAELQGRLAMADVADSKAQVTRSLILLSIAPVLALAALPVLVLGIADALAEWQNWSPGVVRLTTGGCVVVIAGLLGWVGWRRLMTSGKVFQRSRSEFSENLRWFKSVLRSPPPEPSGDRLHRAEVEAWS